MAETDPKVLGVENLLSSLKVMVRFICREDRPLFGLSILGEKRINEPNKLRRLVGRDIHTIHMLSVPMTTSCNEMDINLSTNFLIIGLLILWSHQ